MHTPMFGRITTQLQFIQGAYGRKRFCWIMKRSLYTLLVPAWNALLSSLLHLHQILLNQAERTNKGTQCPWKSFLSTRMVFIWVLGTVNTILHHSSFTQITTISSRRKIFANNAPIGEKIRTETLVVKHSIAGDTKQHDLCPTIL